MKDNNCKNLYQSHIIRAFDREEILMERGEGVYLYDSEGNKYLDFLAGIAVNTLGYNHEKFTKILTKQVNTLIHCSNYFFIAPQIDLAEELAKRTGLQKVFFTNSGAESNEAALKIAKAYFYDNYGLKRNKIMSFKNSFHGRTMGALAATGQEKFQKKFINPKKDYVYAEFNDIEDVKKNLDESVGAVIFEVIQGEGGVIPADEDFMTELNKICKERDILLIVDEVQTGIGRTGYFSAYEYYGIKPDIVTFAKGLGSGIPIGAVVVSEKLQDVIKPGMHGTTFGGNPLSTQAGLAVLKIMDEENILENVKVVGDYMIEQLLKLKERKNSIVDVRGRGLMIGVELDRETKPIYKAALKEGLIISATARNVIRILPPLIIEKKHVDKMIEILEKLI